MAFALASGLPLAVVLPVANFYLSRIYEERAQAEIVAARAHAEDQLRELSFLTQRRLDQLLLDERLTEILSDGPRLLRLLSSEEPHRQFGLDAVFVVAQGRFVANTLELGNTGPLSPGEADDFERARRPDRTAFRLMSSVDGSQVLYALASRDLGPTTVVGARAVGPAFLADLESAHAMTSLIASADLPPFDDLVCASCDPASLARETAATLQGSWFRESIPIPLPSGGSRSLILLKSKDELYRIQRNLFGFFAALFGSTLVISWITGRTASQPITHPVDELVGGFSRVAGGNLDVVLLR